MSIVARRYALALMNLAARAKAVEAVSAALDEMADTLAESPQLQAFLVEPKISPTAKEAVVEALVTRGKVPGLVGNFLRFVTRKRRIELLPDIRAEFHELSDERMGRANAQVVVATALSDPQTKALRERLRGLTGKEVRLQVQVDPAILGGVVARVGSTVWDGSLRNQLDRIQHSIAD
jgi:F-type H+-transporting ATPase subunit delta